MVDESVTAPMEEKINGVENMIYMSSKSASDGSCNITVTFEVGTDIAWTVPLGTDVTNLAPTFDLSFAAVAHLYVEATDAPHALLALALLLSAPSLGMGFFMDDHAHVRIGRIERHSPQGPE